MAGMLAAVRDLTVRDGTQADMPALLALWRELEEIQAPVRIFPLVPDAEELIAGKLIDAMAHEDARVLVAEREGEIVGMAVAWFEGRDDGLDATPLVDLSRVVVTKAHRRAGVGDALVAEAEAWGAARGARWLQAHLFSGNADGRAFWAARGFVPRYEARVRPIDAP